MLRLTELKLPLEHPPEALEKALTARLGGRPGELMHFTVARRAWDARKRTAVELVYTLEIEVVDEAALLGRAARDKVLARTLGATPDTSYRQVARAPSRMSRRPVVIGTGPAGGIFSAGVDSIRVAEAVGRDLPGLAVAA